MPRSRRSMLLSGGISHRAMSKREMPGPHTGPHSGPYNKTAAQTRSVSGRMADFDESSKDEGAGRIHGPVAMTGRRHIDQNQRKAPPGQRGPNATAAQGSSPKSDHIDNYPNTRKNPPGSNLGKAEEEVNPHNIRFKGKGKVARNIGKKSTPKNYYGGPASKANY